LANPQKRNPLKSKPKANAATMKITSPIPLKIKMRVSTSTLAPIVRDRAPARTNMDVFILDLELRNGEDRLSRLGAGPV
jgi:hypothetical protein